MFDAHKTQPLLAQVPLTISPFVQIPVAVSLPYTFKSVASALPPSVLEGGDNNGEKVKYVTSSSGHAAHPEDIAKSCTALQSHLAKSAADSQKSIEEWQTKIKERDLAEKRRVAPGWLDREEKLLQPVSKQSPQSDLLATEPEQALRAPAMSPSREGEELDRAFGGLSTR